MMCLRAPKPAQRHLIQSALRHRTSRTAGPRAPHASFRSEISHSRQHTPIRMLAVAPSSTDRARSGHVTQYPRAPNVKRFEKLDGDDFRHPLDQQNTALLRSLPGLEMVARTVLGGPGFEEALYLENIGAALQVGPDQLPTLHRLHLQASSCLNMDPPALYVRQDQTPNAYTLAIAGKKPFIMLNTSLLELLNEAELQSVIAHELGHLKCDHGVWLTIGNVLASGTMNFLPLVSSAVEEALFKWMRAAELTCDRSALLVSQDPKVVVSALMKLAGGAPRFAHELNVDAFLDQARSYDEATASPLGTFLRSSQNRYLSHPLPVMRAREIDRWALGTQYRTLLARDAAKA